MDILLNQPKFEFLRKNLPSKKKRARKILQKKKKRAERGLRSKNPLQIEKIKEGALKKKKPQARLEGAFPRLPF